ncbi:MAG: hypothetical protein CFE44_16550 [Burkholderiales bacterium PBB4]|nr:MAG: hypothetical protein CFE44_16550 [Burkholderiales bacterium PBB4]
MNTATDLSPASIPATAAIGGPRPTVEEFNEAIRKLEARGQKITRRAVRDVTGGTMSVVNRLCREYEAAQAAAMNAYALPPSLASQIRALIQAERHAAVQDMQRQLDEEKDKVAELENQVDILEPQLRQLTQERDAERAQKMAAEALLKDEREAHQQSKQALDAKCEELEQRRRDEAKLEGELQAQLDSQHLRERDHKQVLARQDELIAVVADLAARVAQMTSSSAHPRAQTATRQSSTSGPPPLPVVPRSTNTAQARPHLSQEAYEQLVRKDPSLDDGIVF